MARQLEFKQRVRFNNDIALPAIAEPRTIPPFALPVAAYWAICFSLIYGIASGVLPMRRWLDGEDEAVAEEPSAFVESEPASPLEPPPEAPPVAPPVAAVAPPAAVFEQVEEHPAEPSLEAAPESEARLMPEQAPEESAPATERSAPAAPEPTPEAPVTAARVAAPPPIELVETPWIPEVKEAPPERPRRRVDPAPPPPEPTPTLPAIASCEAAVAANQEQMDLTRRGPSAPDVTREAYAGVLENGSYLAPCNVPDHVALDLCVAVRDGRAVGITVSTSPANARLRACVTRAVQRIAFPSSPRLDVTRTRFSPAR